MNLIRCENGHMYSAKKHGKVCPYCNATSDNVSKNTPNKSVRKFQTISHTSDNSSKTLAFWDDHEGFDPVVGWLVCIEGTMKGQDFRIRPEKNFIGRSEEMHIYLAGDNAISRKNHAVISYNPKERNFFLIPGDGVGIVYHNNEAVYSPMELTTYDLIQMGKSKFIFIPLCGMHFEWDNQNQDDIDKEAL